MPWAHLLCQPTWHLLLCQTELLSTFRYVTAICNMRSFMIIRCSHVLSIWSRYVADLPNSARGCKIPNTLRLQAILRYDADRQLDCISLYLKNTISEFRSVCLYFVQLSQETAIISQHCINCMVFLTVMLCVLFPYLWYLYSDNLQTSQRRTMATGGLAFNKSLRRILTNRNIWSWVISSKISTAQFINKCSTVYRMFVTVNTTARY